MLPLNYSDNWLVKHFSNYLGVEKPMIILENYESDKGYFPVNWNRKSKPNLLVGSQNLNSFLCFEWKTNIENPVTKIDYVFIIGNPENVKDSCNTALLREVVAEYRMIYQTENCRLYELNAHHGGTEGTEIHRGLTKNADDAD